MTVTGHWHPAYIGIGSNLDAPETQVRRALAELASLPDAAAFASSGLYRSAPLGPSAQPDYINAAAAFLTTLAAPALLRELQALEAAHGRQRSAERWGPRTLDLDLLLFGGMFVDTADLQVPHPRIQERNFVLLPLAEIAPHVRVPGRGSVRQLLSALTGDQPRIERVEQLK